MAIMADVNRLVSALPEVTSGERHGNQTWFVGGKAFAWDRPFSKADIRRFGDQTPPSGPILAIRLADLGEKEAVLVELDQAGEAELREALTDGWLACAPAALAEGFLGRRGLGLCGTFLGGECSPR